MWIVMKYLERFIVNMIKPGVSSLDPLQFTYREGHSTKDAVVNVSHLLSKHLEDSKAYDWLLFGDFSSTFDTVCRHLLVQKLVKL